MIDASVTSAGQARKPLPQGQGALVGVAAAAEQGEVARERTALRSRLDVVTAGRPVRNLHRLATVGATRADRRDHYVALGCGGHGRIKPANLGAS